MNGQRDSCTESAVTVYEAWEWVIVVMLLSAEEKRGVEIGE